MALSIEYEFAVTKIANQDYFILYKRADDRYKFRFNNLIMTWHIDDLYSKRITW